MIGIHNVFPANDNDSNDPILEKKLKQLDGEYSMAKTILGFDFDGVNKTIWLEEAKQAHLLTVLHNWVRLSKVGMIGIPFKEFKLWLPRSDMHSWLYLRDRDSSPHAIKSSKQNHHLSTSSATRCYRLQ
jgi:hypothetical protein